MTDRDKIELPPLPPFVIAPIADEQTVRDYARAAVLADRERRPCVGASEGERIAELVKAPEHAQREVLDMKIKDAEDRTCRAEQAKPAKPKVHRARVYLTRTGYAWHTQQAEPCATVTLCWTDDGRAWIESEKNRELARLMRKSAGIPISDEERLMISAADALDGDVR